ncbi:MAG: GNAT family N-acetyltransferase [Promethearchaeota archaeon]
MAKFIPLDLDVHKAEFIQLNLEHLTWVSDELLEHYDIDIRSQIPISLREYVEGSINSFASLKPPSGIFYLLDVDGKIGGMGGIRKLREDTGEIKRMYINPKHRGEGFGKRLLELLMKKGEDFGFSRFVLDTGPFMKTAQYLYRSAGFVEIEGYPESEILPAMRKVWLFMGRNV